MFDRMCFSSTSTSPPPPIGKAALADRYDGGRNATESDEWFPTQTHTCTINTTQGYAKDQTHTCIYSESHLGLWFCSEFVCSVFPILTMTVQKVYGYFNEGKITNLHALIVDNIRFYIYIFLQVLHIYCFKCRRV